MNQITINLPNRFSNNFGEPISAIFNLIEDINKIDPASEILFNYDDAKFTHPHFTITIPLIAKMYERKNYNISINSNFSKQSVSDYMSLIKFPTGINPSIIVNNDYSTFFTQYSNKTYIPLINFPTSEKETISKIRDDFFSAINQLIKQQANLSSNIRSAVMYLIDEAINNVLHHSLDDQGYILAQVYKDNGYIDIAIADIGRTLLQSYESTGRHNQINTHLLAMKAALDGKSTKSNNVDRGFGISSSKKMLTKGLNGKYFIYSGNVFNIHTSERNEIIELSSTTFWQGVYLAMRIPLVPKADFIAENYYE